VPRQAVISDGRADPRLSNKASPSKALAGSARPFHRRTVLMPQTLLPRVCEGARAMIFVDGENLAIRYQCALSGRAARPEVQHEPDVFVWSPALHPQATSGTPDVIRKYYYTAVKGDDDRIAKIEDDLKTLGFETPRVFKKQKDRGSKQVDISLATDMLVHATRKHYDVAVLVAGDEDYIPLVRAVQFEGARVHIWFVSNGLSPRLRRVADHFVDLNEFLLPEG
jgi:uncharacterized LabA/DUF88 family protein